MHATELIRLKMMKSFLLHVFTVTVYTCVMPVRIKHACSLLLLGMTWMTVCHHLTASVNSYLSGQTDCECDAGSIL